ncbi:hypothetical protein BABINDRAFT_80759 [Babjeviella inositovora NRRL Y-12698]|uniref:Uncharacterized protein n=1 Tax=Babjeviella inositovora NRRL Y-12698 TaxID=984486 RepID=A0A1E3QZJ0_9ASCO|nr:uncharacterized protein BABINDRAFT_80759 [Babjeviella inositovora NRRL Y-12698]ODQ83090.1 hypothetical protein BABINDRAFT_80759 [Babjeviella inositovora NRRL Y-12698]
MLKPRGFLFIRNVLLTIQTSRRLAKLLDSSPIRDALTNAGFDFEEPSAAVPPPKLTKKKLRKTATELQKSFNHILSTSTIVPTSQPEQVKRRKLMSFRSQAVKTMTEPEFLRLLQRLNRNKDYVGVFQACRAFQRYAKGLSPQVYREILATLPYISRSPHPEYATLMRERLLEFAYNIVIELAIAAPQHITNDLFLPLLKVLDSRTCNWASIQNFDSFLEQLDRIIHNSHVQPIGLDFYVLLKNAHLLFFKASRQYEQAVDYLFQELVDGQAPLVLLPSTIVDLIQASIGKKDYSRSVRLFELAQGSGVTVPDRVWHDSFSAGLDNLSFVIVKYIYDCQIKNSTGGVFSGVLSVLAYGRMLELFSKNQEVDATIDLVEHITTSHRRDYETDEDVFLSRANARYIIDSYCHRNFRLSEIWTIVEAFLLQDSAYTHNELTIDDLDTVVRSFRLYDYQNRHRELYSLQMIDGMIEETFHSIRLEKSMRLFVQVVLRILHQSVNLSGFIYGFAKLQSLLLNPDAKASMDILYHPDNLRVLFHKIGMSNASKLSGYYLFKLCLKNGIVVSPEMYQGLLRSQMVGKPNWRFIFMYLYEYLKAFGTPLSHEMFSTMETLIKVTNNQSLAQLLEDLSKSTILQESPVVLKTAFMNINQYYTRDSTLVTKDIDLVDFMNIVNSSERVTESAFLNDFIPAQYRGKVEFPVKTVFGKLYHYVYRFK